MLNSTDIKNIMLVVTMTNFLLVTMLIGALTNGKAEAEKHSILAGYENGDFEQTAGEEERDDESDSGFVLNITATADIVANDDYLESRDDSMEKIFCERIVGKYRINDSMVYKFGMNGIYSGFFDDNHQNVSGYSYEILVTDDQANLFIYNSDKTQVVTYELLLFDDSSIAIIYPSANLKIILKE